MEKSIQKLIDLLKSLLPNENYIGGNFSSETAFKRAETEKLDVIIPTKYQLQIDIDGPLGQLLYDKNIDTFNQFYATAEREENPSKSGVEGRKHITLTLKDPVEPTERLLLQAFLGSDLTREFLGLQRIKAGDGVPTLFLEKHPEPIIISTAGDNDIPF